MGSWLFILAAIATIISCIVIFIPRGSGPNPNANSSTPSPSDNTTPSPAGGNATNTPLATVPTPAAIFPCNVDVGTWTSGSPDWKMLNGMLLNDGTNTNPSGPGPTIVAPCQLGNATNYAVETKIQATGPTSYACFGITVRGSSAPNGWQGYLASVGGPYADHCDVWGEAWISGSSYLGDGVGQAKGPFDPGQNSHTYRVEVNGNVITFLVDGSQLLTLTDNRYLTGSQVGLWDYGMQLQVTSFVVTAL